VGENTVGWDSPSIEMLYPFNILRPEAGNVAINFVYRSPLKGLRNKDKGSRFKVQGKNISLILLSFILVPWTLILEPLPLPLFKLMRADLSLHIIEKPGPELGLEGGNQFLRGFCPAFGTGEVFVSLPYLLVNFKFM